MGTPKPYLPPERFTVLETLADTAVERRFRAVDRVLEKEVMLKLPGESFAGWSAPARTRLLREARALAKIEHPCISPIHWVDETPVGPLLVFDLPAGEALAERLQRGTLEPDEVIGIGLCVAEALACVHAAGVVHRAVGPSSIRLLANGKVQLGSFTFAKEADRPGHGSSLAHADELALRKADALPDYSAPEQLAGQAADARADLWALGCTLYRCLCGSDPFPRGVEARPLPPLAKLRPGVDKRLVEVIRRCTQAAKTARYSSAAEVGAALRSLQAPASQGAGSGRLAVAALAAGGALAVGLWLGFGGGDANGGSGNGSRGPEAPLVDWSPRYQKTFSADYDRVHGLFVGIGEAYRGTSMKGLFNPVHEVEAVAQRLRENDPQWAAPDAIKILSDHAATLEAILVGLEHLENKEKTGENDAVLVWFAGHAVRDGYQFGLAAADVVGSIDHGDNFVPRERLLNFLDKCPAKHVLVVLDCCHAGAVVDIGLTRGQDPEPVKAGLRYRQHYSREFLCSVSASEQAPDGARLSPFCEQFLDQLKRPAGDGTEFVLARHVAHDIAKVMEQKSGPRFGSIPTPAIHDIAQQKGSFVFKLAKGR